MHKVPMQNSNQTQANKQHIQELKGSWKRMQGMELLSFVHIGAESEQQQCPKTALRLPSTKSFGWQMQHCLWMI